MNTPIPPRRAVHYIPATDERRRILRHGTYNARDAGDYPVEALVGTQNVAEPRDGVASSGLWMRPMSLIHSDAISHLTPEDVAEAEAMGLALVVDLRDPYERDNDVDVEIPGCVNNHQALYRGELATYPPENFPTLPVLYGILLTRHIAQIVEALEAAATTLPRPVLVHCTAGKDRTGLIIALLQALIGVPLDIIVEDYSASEHFLNDDFNRRVVNLYDRAGVDRRVIGPEPTAAPGHYLRDTLDGLIRDSGSIEKFLTSNGLSPATIERLRATMVVNEADATNETR